MQVLKIVNVTLWPMRETGNYEIALKDTNGTRILKLSFVYQ